MALNQNIKNKRYECGMSQRELADAVGISQALLHQIFCHILESRFF